MEIQQIQISLLKFDDNNFRQHNFQNIQMIKNSIKNYGQYKPLIVDKDSFVVLVGNGRLQALKQLGYITCKCILIQKSQQIAILDNRLNELSYWNDIELQDWLINTKGLQWWGIDSFLSQELMKRKKKTKVEKKSKKDSNKHICPCCGQQLKKVFDIT